MALRNRRGRVGSTLARVIWLIGCVMGFYSVLQGDIGGFTGV